MKFHCKCEINCKLWMDRWIQRSGIWFRIPTLDVIKIYFQRFYFLVLSLAQKSLFLLKIQSHHNLPQKKSIFYQEKSNQKKSVFNQISICYASHEYLFIKLHTAAIIFQHCRFSFNFSQTNVALKT